MKKRVKAHIEFFIETDDLVIDAGGSIQESLEDLVYDAIADLDCTREVEKVLVKGV